MSSWKLNMSDRISLIIFILSLYLRARAWSRLCFLNTLLWPDHWCIIRALRSVMKCFPDKYSRAFPDSSTRCGPAKNKYTRKMAQNCCHRRQNWWRADNGYLSFLKDSSKTTRQCTWPNMKFPQTLRNWMNLPLCTFLDAIETRFLVKVFGGCCMCMIRYNPNP